MRHATGTARVFVVCAVLIIMALGVPGVAKGGSSATLVHVAHSAKLGRYLTTAGGKTLYYMTLESHGKIACTGTCTKFWPPYLVARGIVPASAMAGLHGKFSFVVRPDKTRQLAYNGHTLYTFAGDKRAGQTNGQGINKVWFVATVTTASPTPAPGGGRYGSGY